MDNIYINCQSSICIKNTYTIYFDPLNINNANKDADFIFLTHPHYDHFSKEDILKVMNNQTIFVMPLSMQSDFMNNFKNINNPCYYLTPGMDIKIKDINIKATFAYNLHTPFHPKSNNWCGYLVSLNETTYYIAGDTDDVLENHNLKCDMAFIPIGGTYTMDVLQACNLVTNIHTSKVIPIHYGSIVGSKEDGNKFKEMLQTNNPHIEVILKI